MTAAGITSLALTGVGVALVVTGVLISLSDRKKKLAAGTIRAEGTAGEVLEGAAKLADALAKYPLGMQLVFIGMVLMLAGAGTGGVAALLACGGTT